MTRLGRSTLLLNSKAPEQMTAECWHWRPRWNRLASSASCFNSSACLQSSSSVCYSYFVKQLLCIVWNEYALSWFLKLTVLTGHTECLIAKLSSTLWFKKNAPTLADYNYDPVQSILFNDHKSCLVVKFSTSPHICCHYTLWNTMLYFAIITLLIAKNAPTSDHHNFNKR